MGKELLSLVLNIFQPVLLQDQKQKFGPSLQIKRSFYVFTFFPLQASFRASKGTVSGYFLAGRQMFFVTVMHH